MGVDVRPVERSVGEWLLRMQGATAKRSYVGTFVVSSAGSLYSSRIWHVCDGSQQVERIETLSGIPRSTFRRNEDVITFFPVSRVARVEKRESSNIFPHLNEVADVNLADFYQSKTVGQDRAAGLDADMVQFVPKDKLRYGYLIWSERKSGLVIKAQTLDAEGRIIEQSAFSELQMDAPIKSDKLLQMMGQTEGFKLEKPEVTRTTAQAEGWQLKNEVPGYKSVNCFRRGMTAAGAGALQWIFSDGLASVSMFIESYDKQRHVQESMRSMGATQSLTRRLHEGTNDWWLTLVGEVPAQTLVLFAQNLERKK